MVITTARSYFKYGFESTHAGTSTRNKVLGLQQAITGLTLDNSRKELGQLEDIRVKTFAYGRQLVAFGVDFVLSNPWFFGAIFGAPATSGAGALKTHTYSVSSAMFIPRTLQFELGLKYNDGSSLVRIFPGSVLKSVSLSTSIDNTVSCSASFESGNEVLTTNTYGNQIDDSINFPYTFAHATLKYEGSTVAQIQSADITFNTNATLLYGLGGSISGSGISGASLAVDSWRGRLDITGKFTGAILNSNKFKDVLDQIGKATLSGGTTKTELSGSPAIELAFNNGLSGTSEKSITIQLSGLGLESHALSNLTPVEPIFEDITWRARDCTVIAKNDTAAEP